MPQLWLIALLLSSIALASAADNALYDAFTTYDKPVIRWSKAVETFAAAATETKAARELIAEAAQR